MTAPPPGYSRKTTPAAAPPPGYKRVEPGLVKRIGDTYENLFRIAGDTVTRGYLDKSIGPQAQARTQQGREQTSDWLEAPTDIAYGLMSSPWRIASTGAGALYGGLEGMASAYGHQKDWTPDVGNMLWEGGKGAALGAGGAKLGEWAGKWWGGRQAAKELPYKTDAELEAASQKSFKEDPTSPQTLDLYDRTARLEAARAAQGEGRGAFAKLLPGNEAEAAAAAAIAKGKSLTTKIGQLASATGKTVSGPALVAEMMTQGIPWKTLAGMAGTYAASKAGQSHWATQVPNKAAETLATIIRDPRGVGAVADPATIDAARNSFARAMIGASRSPTTPNPQDYLNRNYLFGGPR